MIARVFDNIPEGEIHRDGMARDDSWQGTFKHLAERARETTWGLPEWDKAILGVCVMLEESLSREQGLIKDAYLAEDIVKTSHNKLKGLQMENGRYKKELTKVREQVMELTDMVSTNAPPAESESA